MAVDLLEGPAPPKIPARLADLYHRSRFEGMSSRDIILLAMYIPFGLILLPLRLTAWSACIALIRASGDRSPRLRAAVLRGLMALNGWRIVFRGRERVDAPGPKVIAPNHLTLIDCPVLDRLGDVTVLSGVTPTTNLIFRAFEGLIHDRIVIQRDRKHLAGLRAGLAARFASGSVANLICFPEGVIGNGTGLHSFAKFVFTLDVPVVPACLKVEIPFSIRPHPLHHGPLANMLWLFFLPYTRHECTFLEPMTAGPSETPAAFARRVQRRMAEELSAEATDFTAQDKKALKAAMQARVAPTRR